MTDPSQASPHPRRTMQEINEFLGYTVTGSGVQSTPNNSFRVLEGPASSSPPPKRLITAGTGRRKVVDPDSMGSGDRFASSARREPEFPEGGDPRFRAVLSEMLKLHISKSSDYGTNRDPYANYRAAEQIGVSAWKSCFIRGLEKVQRIANAASGKKLNHESAENSFLDLANHVVIAKVLYDEEQERSQPCPCGGNCLC